MAGPPYVLTNTSGGTILIPGSINPLANGATISVTSVPPALAAAITAGKLSCSPSLPSQGTATALGTILATDFSGGVDFTQGQATILTNVTYLLGTLNGSQMLNGFVGLRTKINTLAGVLERTCNDVAAIQSWIASNSFDGIQNP